MIYPALLFVVALAGFIPLSYEMLWYRAFAFASGGAPTIFGQLLFFYLVGLALGSFASRIFCRRHDAAGDRRHLIPLAGFVYAANLLGFLVLPLLSWFSTDAGCPCGNAVRGRSCGFLGRGVAALEPFRDRAR